MLLMLIEVMARAQSNEPAPGFTLSDIWTHSGPIARVVIFMLVCMLLSTFFVTVERLLAFRRGRKQSMRLRNEIIAPLQVGDVGSALRIAADEQFAGGHLTSILRAGLRELEDGQDKFALDAAKRAVAKAHAEELTKLQRGMPILATVGSTAPFVGLFGTTFGVINAFQGMATAGSGLASISSGISEALITTGVGIGVAVFGVWLFNYFNHRIAKVSDELNSSEADFVQWAAKLIQNQMRGAAK